MTDKLVGKVFGENHHIFDSVMVALLAKLIPIIRKAVEEEITDKMHENNWGSLVYFHPGSTRFPDRWVAGTQTGIDNDLICTRKCKTREDEQKYLSPSGNTALEAIDKAIKSLSGVPTGKGS